MDRNHSHQFRFRIDENRSDPLLPIRFQTDPEWRLEGADSTGASTWPPPGVVAMTSPPGRVSDNETFSRAVAISK